jgi:hypothetical protein
MIAAHVARALHADKTTVERVAAVGGASSMASESTVQTVLLGLLVQMPPVRRLRWRLSSSGSQPRSGTVLRAPGYVRCGSASG